MKSDDRILKNEDFINNYVPLQVFVKGISTICACNADSFVTKRLKEKPLPFDKEISVRYYHTSLLWLNNIYSNNLN
ncbi:hypothetical protein OCK74_12385 [Chitinophagaceae bacterium LB-8]|uniref:Uncharacterized protein n=1 Tax=Paraflavisolibacter caeni TaxID=2982496 RepID=A0A9X3B8K9_9BACT|nr:hypothetical protein [Paraflavisolibacter caeni]MCU7549921.1 hypothetical protein [Paraflavisolibacter caeni]